MTGFRLALVIILPLLLSTALFASGFDLVSPGARAEGMAGAQIAVANDTTALFWTPANLAARDGRRVAFSGRWREDDLSRTSASGEQTASVHDHLALGTAGAAYTGRWGERAVAAGLAYFRPMELVTHYQGRDIGGGVSTWTPGAAVAVTRWLSVGAALNVWGGTRDFDETVNDTAIWWEADYSGANAVVGARFDFGELGIGVPVQAGMIVRTPFDLRIEYADRFAGPGGTTTTAWQYWVEMPWMVGLGVSAEPLPRLLVAFDYEHRHYSSCELTAESSDGQHTVTPVSASGQDLDQLRLGLEYQLSLGGWRLPLRAGYRRAPTLSADWLGAAYGDQAVANAWCAGFGLGRGPLVLDVALSRSAFDRESHGATGRLLIEQTFNTVMVGLTLTLD